MNRADVKKALAAWRRAEKADKRVLGDREIQALFEQGTNDRAKEIIAIRYPDAAHRDARRLALAKAVIAFAPGVKLDPAQVCRNAAHFNRILDLAERM